MFREILRADVVQVYKNEVAILAQKVPGVEKIAQREYCKFKLLRFHLFFVPLPLFPHVQPPLFVVFTEIRFKSHRVILRDSSPWTSNKCRRLISNASRSI